MWTPRDASTLCIEPDVSSTREVKVSMYSESEAMNMRVVRSVACACLSLVTASVLAANGPGQSAGAGSARVPAAPGGGHHGQTVGRQGGQPRPTSRARPSRLTSTLAVGLPSRRFAPWFGALVGAEPLVLSDPDTASGSAAGEVLAAPVIRDAYPEPSSIQPL